LTKVVRFGDVTVRWTATSEGTAVTDERHGFMSGVQRLSPAQRAIDLWMREEAFSQKPSMPLTAPSLSSIMIVRSCCGGRAISYDRLSRAMARSWTSLKHPHVGFKCIQFVRRWMTGRSCRQESTGLEKVVALPRG
jgi:hypothetical protein